MTMHPEHTFLRGRVKLILQAVWLTLVTLLLTIFAIAIPMRFSYLTGNANGQNLSLYGLPVSLESAFTSHPGPQELDAMTALGMSPTFYATYILVFEVGLAVVCATIGFLIFWRKREEWMALLFSFILVLLGTNGVVIVIPTLVTVSIGWALVSTFAQFLGMTTNLLILFLSPDGRFVPKWSGLVSAGFVGLMLAVFVYLVYMFNIWGLLAGDLLVLLASPFWMILILLGIASQIYRYLRVSGPMQRQQTKWVVVGLGAVTLGFVLNILFLVWAGEQHGIARLLDNMIRVPLVIFCMMLLPVFIALSILRYRLWDIDIIIRRTITYSILTAILGAVYFALVVLSQQLFRAVTGQNSELAIIVSTLAIYILFVPLRRRIQYFLYRRFYRRKYDAQQVLAKFAQTARDETDLNRLTDELMHMVNETMQPESVSLWLKKPERKVKR